MTFLKFLFARKLTRKNKTNYGMDFWQYKFHKLISFGDYQYVKDMCKTKKALNYYLNKEILKCLKTS